MQALLLKRKKKLNIAHREYFVCVWLNLIIRPENLSFKIYLIFNLNFFH